MRFIGLVALLLPWAATAQDLEINGYSTVLVRPPLGSSYASPGTITAAIKDAARTAGFEVIEHIEQGDATRTLELLIGIDGRQVATVGVAVRDVQTGSRVASSLRRDAFGLSGAAGSGSGERRALRQEARDLIDKLGYTGYDPAAHQRNMVTLERLRSSNPPSPPQPEPR